MPKKKSTHYVDNEELVKEIMSHKARCAEADEKEEPKPQMTDALGSMILEIATRFAYRPNFINYSYRDEMILDGVENCLTYITNFDTAKSTNAFAYVTQIIYYAFLRRIKKEKKQTYIKFKAYEKHGIHNMYSDVKDMYGDPDAAENHYRKHIGISEKDIDSFNEETKKKPKKGKK